VGDSEEQSPWIVLNSGVPNKQEMSYNLATAPAVLYDNPISDLLKQPVAQCVRIGTRITAGIVLDSRAAKDMAGYLTRGYGESGLTLWEGKGRVRD